MTKQSEPIRMDGEYVTRDGLCVRVLCVDRKAECDRTVVALVSLPGGGFEYLDEFSSDGFHISENSPTRRDLVPAPKRELEPLPADREGQQGEGRG